MTFKAALLALIIAGLPAAALARSQKSTTHKKENYRLPPYGMAGCGPGAVIISGDGSKSIFETNTAGLQILAASSNLSSLHTQLLAISSATSNCTNYSLSNEEAFRIERETYVTLNLNDLKKEAAQGQGDKLRGLSEMLGCTEQKEVETFAQLAQVEHDSIFSDAQPDLVTKRWVGVAKGNKTLTPCLNKQ